ncbi:PREDICTED: uncharacterized protein LOC109207281 [Nicotiana attenuata]|uniref:uncharacterized protein LOC109207281 n=1 Tax=Nicotiana attenuata TaxID=49451 RepID=UPI0009058169|nr:PREDICTED: uncharacterized protein LOC109207281 [Nicotiana attenuata]
MASILPQPVSGPRLQFRPLISPYSVWLASYLGRPICTDKLTAIGDRISYARVLIEMCITQQLPELITIEKSDGTIWEQDIDYEWKPRFCQNCAHFAHFTKSCGKEDQQEQNVQQKGQKKGKQKPSQEKKEWKVKQDKPNIKPQDPIAVEEDHSAHTKVQVQRSGKQVVVFQGQRQGNQHEVQSHQEEDLDSDLEETLGINQYSSLRCYEEAVEKRIDLIGCLETRVKQHKAVKVIRKFGNDWEFYTDYTHAPNGRIWVGWRRASVVVNIRYSTAQLIHWRKPLWDKLRNIKGSINGPSILFGDFNTILFSDDRVNGVPVHPAETVDFQNCITEVGQVTRKGWLFSWCNKRDENEMIYSHIDWVFGNADWLQTYGSIEANYLNYECSDHSPIDAFKAIVQNMWQQTIEGHCMYGVWQKLKLVEAETK